MLLLVGYDMPGEAAVVGLDLCHVMLCKRSDLLIMEEGVQVMVMMVMVVDVTVANAVTAAATALTPVSMVRSMGTGVGGRRLPDECLFQDRLSLLIPLSLLPGKLVHPAQFDAAALAGDIADKMLPRDHDTIMDLGVDQVHDFVEEKGCPRRPRELLAHQLALVRQEGVTLFTRVHL